MQYNENEVKELAKKCAIYKSFIIDLTEWLKGEKYLIDENSDKMTTEFEDRNKWKLSRNYFINKTLKYIEGNLYEE